VRDYHLKKTSGEKPFIFHYQSDDVLVTDSVNLRLLKEGDYADVRSILRPNASSQFINLLQITKPQYCFSLNPSVF